ncbi:MAG: hypothetical protein ACF788_03880 [Novipirellula sp. JB048]
MTDPRVSEESSACWQDAVTALVVTRTIREANDSVPAETSTCGHSHTAIGTHGG